jgi:2-oxoglutarate dehydrogenase E2 component (dihydrolipoamide succinyltransferase)
MSVDMVMPQMGESITEATISRWLKKPGDTVAKDEIILEISTDKVDSEIPSPAAGVLAEVLFNEGDVVPVKEKIAVISSDGAAAKTASSQASSPASVQENIAPQQVTPPQAAAPQLAKVVDHNGSAHAHDSNLEGKFVSPVVKSLAEKHGVAQSELTAISGSGQGGRVTKQDFMSYLDNRGNQQLQQNVAQQQASQQFAMPPAATTPAIVAPAPVSQEYRPPAVDIPGDSWSADGTKIVPMDKMRTIIADHMVRSKHTSPHVYSVQEVDCSRISAWRAKYKGEFQKREGFSLSFTPFFLEAAVRALMEFPIVNSSVDGNKIIMKRNINLGCAVALGNSGLIVPVIKRAEERNFVGLARGLNDLALRARNKKLLPDEVTGGSFTVTNPGVFGTMIGTPIINQPQVAILCLGAIKKRPVVIDDMIGIREICYLTLSYDHRIIDGAVGGQYLAFIREYLENWDMDRPLA